MVGSRCGQRTAATETTSKLYPELSKLLGNGFDLSNSKTAEQVNRIQTELVALTIDDRVVTYLDKNNREQNLVKMPVATTDKSFDKSKDSYDTVMQLNAVSTGDIANTARRVTTHLIKNYKDSFMEAAERADIPICKPMSETAFAAMLKATNISGKQEVEMRKYLRDHLGKNFLPTRASVEMMCEGHTPVYTDKTKHIYENG